MSKGINTTCDEGQTPIPTTGGGFDVAHSLRGEGFDASEDGTGLGTPLVPVGVFQDSEFGVQQYDSAGTLRAGRIPEHQMVLQPVHAFDASEDGTGRGTPLVPVFTGDGITADGITADPITANEGKTYTQEGNTFRMHNCVGDAFGFVQNQRDEVRTMEVSGALAAEPGAKQQTYVAFQPRIARNGRGNMGDVVNALQAQSGSTGKGDAAPCVATSMQVRRLTPRECERLQGFPDDYTLIPHRGKPAADGPRYKALGNSMAVPCMAWIGQRIAMVEQLKTEIKNAEST